MINKKLCLTLFAFLFVLVSQNYPKKNLYRYENWPVVRGPYLGQKPPGLKPEIFSPGLISRKGSAEGGTTFSADGKLLLFKRSWKRVKNGEAKWDQQIWFSQQKNGFWTKPVRAPFDDTSVNWDFNFAPVKNRFYFTSRRYGEINNKKAKYSNIWMTEFENGKWTRPAILNDPVNVIDHWSGYPSLSKNGNIYFHSERKVLKNVVNIYYSPLEHGVYKKAVKIKSPLNSPYRDFDPCISPDESFIIFLSNRKNPSVDAELFVSFKDSGGDWSEPISMVSEFSRNAFLPMVSSDGKYIFFVRKMKSEPVDFDVFWVDAKIVEKFRSKDKSARLKQQEINY